MYHSSVLKPLNKNRHSSLSLFVVLFLGFTDKLLKRCQVPVPGVSSEMTLHVVYFLNVFLTQKVENSHRKYRNL